MPKAIVYVFGPDGAGKSTVANGLAEALPGVISFNASQPASWPDTSWHEEILAQGLDPNTLDPTFHMESIRRCYRAASGLLRLGDVNTVIIDSDLRTKAAAKAGAWYGHGEVGEIYGQLSALAKAELPPNTTEVGLHVTVGGELADRTTTILGRVAGRGQASFYDPTSAEATSLLVRAFDAIEATIQTNGDPVVRVETDHAIDMPALVGSLAVAGVQTAQRPL
jgi:hypothetical protein